MKRIVAVLTVMFVNRAASDSRMKVLTTPAIGPTSGAVTVAISGSSCLIEPSQKRARIVPPCAWHCWSAVASVQPEGRVVLWLAYQLAM